MTGTHTHTTEPAQRERALAAMTELVATRGYAQTTVAQVTRHARISRAKFYEQFKDKQNCFIAAQRRLAEQLTGEVHGAMRDSAAVDAWRGTMTAW